MHLLTVWRCVYSPVWVPLLSRADFSSRKRADFLLYKKIGTICTLLFPIHVGALYRAKGIEPSPRLNESDAQTEQYDIHGLCRIASASHFSFYIPPPPSSPLTIHTCNLISKHRFTFRFTLAKFHIQENTRDSQRTLIFYFLFLKWSEDNPLPLLINKTVYQQDIF